MAELNTYSSSLIKGGKSVKLKTVIISPRKVGSLDELDKAQGKAAKPNSYHPTQTIIGSNGVSVICSPLGSASQSQQDVTCTLIRTTTNEEPNKINECGVELPTPLAECVTPEPFF